MLLQCGSYLFSANPPDSTIVKNIASKALTSIDQYPSHLKFSCTPHAYVIILCHHPMSSSYVIILRHHPTVQFFIEMDLNIQGYDKNLITIGNKPVFPQSLILTSDQQVLVPQSLVTVTRFVTARSLTFPGTLSTVPAPLLKQLLRLCPAGSLIGSIQLASSFKLYINLNL
jgi:hypothetical protein